MGFLLNFRHFLVRHLTGLLGDFFRLRLKLIGPRFVVLSVLGGFAGFFNRFLGLLLGLFCGGLFVGIVVLGGGVLGHGGGFFEIVRGFLEIANGVFNGLLLFRGGFVFLGRGFFRLGCGLFQIFPSLVEFFLGLGLALLSVFLDGWDFVLGNFARDIGEIADGVELAGQVFLFPRGFFDVLFGFVGGLVGDVLQFLPHVGVVFERIFKVF